MESHHDSSNFRSPTTKPKSWRAVLAKPDEGHYLLEEEFSSWVAAATERNEDGSCVLESEFDMLDKDLEVGELFNVAPANSKRKNRYHNILCYAHNRVVLDLVDGAENSDYINASHIGDSLPSLHSSSVSDVNSSSDQTGAAAIAEEGLAQEVTVESMEAKLQRATGVHYISAAAPLPSTIDDWWRMVWGENVRIIVNLTQFIEEGRRKADLYWPEHEDRECEDTYGDVTVTLVDRQDYGPTVVRRFDISKPNHPPREVTLLHFVAWPDRGAPHVRDYMRFFKIYRLERHRAHSTDAKPHTRQISKSRQDQTGSGDLGVEDNAEKPGFSRATSLTVFTTGTRSRTTSAFPRSSPESPRTQFVKPRRNGRGSECIPTAAITRLWPIKSVQEEPHHHHNKSAASTPPKFNNHKILVHCSAGVGRSGSFIAVDLILDRLARDKAFAYANAQKRQQRRESDVQSEGQDQRHSQSHNGSDGRDSQSHENGHPRHSQSQNQPRPSHDQHQQRPSQSNDQNPPGRSRDQSQHWLSSNQSQPRQSRDQSQPRQSHDQSQPRQSHDQSQPRQSHDMQGQQLHNHDQALHSRQSQGECLSPTTQERHRGHLAEFESHRRNGNFAQLKSHLHHRLRSLFQGKSVHSTVTVTQTSLAQLNGKPGVSVFDVVRHLRKQRPSMVQTVEQYIFIHEVVAQAIKHDLTSEGRMSSGERTKERTEELFDWLPDPLLHYMLSFLTGADVAKTQSLSRTWSKLCTSEELWQFLDDRVDASAVAYPEPMEWNAQQQVLRVSWARGFGPSNLALLTPLDLLLTTGVSPKVTQTVQTLRRLRKKMNHPAYFFEGEVDPNEDVIRNLREELLVELKPIIESLDLLLVNRRKIVPFKPQGVPRGLVDLSDVWPLSMEDALLTTFSMQRYHSPPRSVAPTAQPQGVIAIKVVGQPSEAEALIKAIRVSKSRHFTTTTISEDHPLYIEVHPHAGEQRIYQVQLAHADAAAGLPKSNNFGVIFIECLKDIYTAIEQRQDRRERARVAQLAALEAAREEARQQSGSDDESDPVEEVESESARLAREKAEAKLDFAKMIDTLGNVQQSVGSERWRTLPKFVALDTSGLSNNEKVLSEVSSHVLHVANETNVTCVRTDTDVSKLDSGVSTVEMLFDMLLLQLVNL